MQSASAKAIAAGVLSADVADAGTFTLSFPARPAGEYGTFNLGDFTAGVEPQIVVGGNTYNGPKQVSLTFSATQITVTNKSGATWKSGAAWTLQVPQPGRRVFRTERGAAPRALARTSKTQEVICSLGAPIASDDDGVMLSSSPGAGALTFAGALVSGGEAVFDVPRNIIITSGGNDSGITFTITGKDEYGNTMVETITGANAGIANGKKAFKKVTTTPTKSGASAGTVKIGTGDVLGVPVFLPKAGHILKELEDGAVAAAGTTVAGITTSGGSTATTGDVRGTYDPNSACDGAKSFQLILSLPDPDYLGMAQFAG